VALAVMRWYLMMPPFRKRLSPQSDAPLSPDKENKMGTSECVASDDPRLAK
jgi:hypothetical protein